MNCYYIAVGDGGVRAARAMLFALACGAVDAEEMNFLLIAPSEKEEASFAELCGQYSTVSAHMLRKHAPKAGFSARVSAEVWPAREHMVPLSAQCNSVKDQWLIQQLFTAGEASEDPLNGYGPAAALTWEQLLMSEEEHTLRRFVKRASREESAYSLLVCGALGEPVSAAGLHKLLEWLGPQLPPENMKTVLLLPVSEKESAPSAKAALLLLEHLRDNTAVIGLPRDCWAEDRGAHFVDWLSAAALHFMMKGRQGPFTFRVPLSDVTWDAFGEDAQRWREAYQHLFSFSFLMLTEFAPAAASMLTHPNWLRDRLVNWYNVCFLKIEHLTEEGRVQSAREVEQAQQFLAAYVLWLSEVQCTLPMPLRSSEGLQNARETASAHYALILDKAGEISQLQYDLKQSGMDTEDVVHRREEEESDAEKALRQLHEMREELLAMYKTQEEMNQHIGGRMQRIMLDEALQHCRQEADEARAQLAHARTRIEEASRFATEKDSALLVAAQSRMELLEHHLVAMDGRTACAQRDAKAALAPDISSRPPLEDEVTSGSLLFDSSQFSYLQRSIQAGDREIRLLRQEAGGHWPLSQTAPEMAQSRLSRLAAEIASPDPTATFFTAVFSLSCDEGGTER